MNEELQAKLAELGRLNQLQEDTKSRIDSLKAWFERYATAELTDTKAKTWEISNDVASVAVGNSDTVKVISPTLLREIFGPLSNDFLKEEIATSLKDTVKPTLAGIFLGNYIQQHPSEVIRQITSDPAEQKPCRKN